MVSMVTLPECQRGEHDKCPEADSGGAKLEDMGGGFICDCPCHMLRANPDWKPPEWYKKKKEPAFWAAIENSSDRSEFELYLRVFPDGPHAELARRKLADPPPTRP